MWIELTLAIVVLGQLPEPKVGATSTIPPLDRQKLEKALRPAFTRPTANGLLIFDVIPGSQASKAGFQVGDIITHFNGQPVTTLAKLEQLARSASKDSHGPIAVTAVRAGKEIETQFDPAPLGTRLVAVKKGQSRILWRDESRFTPTLEALQNATQTPVQYEEISLEGKVVGWQRYIVRGEANVYVYRQQSWMQTPGGGLKNEVIVQFRPDRYLSPQRIQTKQGDRTVLSLSRQGEMLVGDRMGVAVEAPVERDLVSAAMVGQLASMMPRTQGTCLRMSYLETAAQTPAPFADICCFGEEYTAGERVARYEVSVFGEKQLDLSLDSKGRVIRRVYASGLESSAASEAVVHSRFADSLTQFPDISASLEPEAPPLRAN